jgi:hypothetical protein
VEDGAVTVDVSSVLPGYRAASVLTVIGTADNQFRRIVHVDLR